MATHHIFGIRHHGPGSARALLRALSELQPDAILESPSTYTIIEAVSARIISPPNSRAFSGHAPADFPHCVPRWDSGRRRNNWGSAGRGRGNEGWQGVGWWVLRGCHDGGRRPAVVVSERQGVVGDEQIGLAIGIAVEPAVDLG